MTDDLIAALIGMAVGTERVDQEAIDWFREQLEEE